MTQKRVDAIQQALLLLGEVAVIGTSAERLAAAIQLIRGIGSELYQELQKPEMPEAPKEAEVA